MGETGRVVLRNHRLSGSWCQSALSGGSRSQATRSSSILSFPRRLVFALFLLVPDHVHALVAPVPDKSLIRVVGDWKRFASTQHGIAWQKNFIDHRIRSDEGVEEKAAYIRMNPFRAGLIGGGEKWPHVIENLA